MASEMVMASGKQTETLATTTLMEGITGTYLYIKFFNSNLKHTASEPSGRFKSMNQHV